MMIDLKTLSLLKIINENNLEQAAMLFNMARPSLKLKAATENAEQAQGLMDILNNAKQVPVTTSVVQVPVAIDNMDMQNLQDISLLDTYISVAASLMMYKVRPQGWNVTDPIQAADFTKALTNARLRILTEGLSGFLSVQESLAQSFATTTTSGDLHADFLTKIFSSFGFAPSAMKQLDSILTAVVKNLSSMQFSYEGKTETVDHLISLYYFEKVAGLEVKVPMMRIFFLHIDQGSWRLAVGKSSVTKFNFHMNYADNKAAMSLTQMSRSRDIVQNYVTEMTHQSLENIKRLTQPFAIQTDRHQ